ncbi:unnamed protein product [Rhizophagus irregularis]|nr:unnamed protein product [Rhizophagus irregularis]
MSDDETDKGYNEFIEEYGSKYEWDNEGNPEFIPEWKDWENLFCKIKIYWKTKAIRHWREKILKKFVYSLPGIRNPASLFHIKRCNDVIKLCKNHLREVFHKGLSPESQRYIERFGCYYDHDLDPDKMVEMLIQAEKENAPDFITAFSDCLRQVSNVQILTQSGFSNNNFISAFLNLELTRPSMAGWYTTNLTSPEQ